MNHFKSGMFDSLAKLLFHQYCSSVDFVCPPASQPPADGLWGVTPSEPSILPTALAPILMPNIHTNTQCSYFSVCPLVLLSHRLGSRVTPCHSAPSWASSAAVLRPLATLACLMRLWPHFWPLLVPRRRKLAGHWHWQWFVLHNLSLPLSLSLWRQYSKRVFTGLCAGTYTKRLVVFILCHCGLGILICECNCYAPDCVRCTCAAENVTSRERAAHIETSKKGSAAWPCRPKHTIATEYCTTLVTFSSCQKYLNKTYE